MMTVDIGNVEVGNGQIRLDEEEDMDVFASGFKNAKASFDYDTEPVTSASDDEDSFADVSLYDDEGEEYARPIKSGSAEDFEAANTGGLVVNTGSMSGGDDDTALDDVHEIEAPTPIPDKQLIKGLASDMVHVSGYLRLDMHTQFLLSEHGIRSLDDLGSLRPKKWKRFHELVQSVTGDDEQARKVSVLRQWIRSIQIPVDNDGERIPHDWRSLFLKALPQLKADARRTDWTNSEDVQMRFIDTLPYSWINFIDSLSQCGLGSLPTGDDY